MAYYNKFAPILTAMPAPQIVGRTQGNRNTLVANTVITLPSGIQAGDMLVIFSGGFSSSAVTCTTPAGWTRTVANAATGSYMRTLDVFHKIADGTETSVTLTYNASVFSAWGAICVRGANNIEAATMQSSITANAPNCPSITSTLGAAQKLFLAIASQTSVGFVAQAAPSGYSDFGQEVAIYSSTNDGPRTMWSSKVSANREEDPPAYPNPIVLSGANSGWFATTLALSA